MKLEEFCDFPENAVDCLSWKLSLGFEFMALIWSMHHAMSEKLDAVHDDVAQHAGAPKSADHSECQLLCLFFGVFFRLVCCLSASI